MNKLLKQASILLFLSLVFSCNAQNEQPQLINRKAVVAGSFYPSDKNKLNKQLETFFKHAIKKQNDNVLAIITPHAGYIYSGQVAASAFMQINPNKKYKHIFIIGPSHYQAFAGASIYYKGNYETPLGEVKTDTSISKKLISENKYFAYVQGAHTQEHCIEVQLPFLQYHLKTDFSIVPIIIGTRSLMIIKQIAAILKPYFNENNLFIISSDFSHYPDYKSAKIADSLSAKAILKNNPKALIKQVQANAAKNYSGLQTSACGLSAIITLLYITQADRSLAYNLIQYKNSGDLPFGNKNRVVGYNAISVNKTIKNNTESFSLSEKDKSILLKIARQTLINYVKENKVPKIDTTTFPDNIKRSCGAFVSLNKQHKLRGCIGVFSSNLPLYKVVQEMTVAAATNDSRFLPVQAKELDKIKIEISVLTPLRKINSLNEIIVGKHGIYLKKGFRHGTLLPQVARNNGWTRNEFINYCAKYKAGIPLNELKDTEIFVYEAIVFDEK